MVQVADVVYKVREVELPAKCPGCQADLRGRHAVHAFEYDTIKKTVTVDEGTTVNWDDYIYGPGEESPVPPVAYHCAACGWELVSGKEEEAADEA